MSDRASDGGDLSGHPPVPPLKVKLLRHCCLVMSALLLAMIVCCTMRQIPDPAAGSATAASADGRARTGEPTAGSGPSENKQTLVLKPEIQTGRSDYYAGSDECLRCHEPVFKNWQSTAHGGVFDSGTESAPHQGSCRRCHWTGDQEQRVGCESCHGAMGSHARKPQPRTPSACRLCEIRKECIRCHTRSISPEFDSSEAWMRIDHGS
jgi:hypothetical protein